MEWNKQLGGGKNASREKRGLEPEPEPEPESGGDDLGAAILYKYTPHLFTCVMSAYAANVSTNIVTITSVQ